MKLPVRVFIRLKFLYSGWLRVDYAREHRCPEKASKSDTKYLWPLYPLDTQVPLFLSLWLLVFTGDSFECLQFQNLSLIYLLFLILWCDFFLHIFLQIIFFFIIRLSIILIIGCFVWGWRRRLREIEQWFARGEGRAWGRQIEEILGWKDSRLARLEGEPTLGLFSGRGVFGFLTEEVIGIELDRLISVSVDWSHATIIISFQKFLILRIIKQTLDLRLRIFLNIIVKTFLLNRKGYCWVKRVLLNIIIWRLKSHLRYLILRRLLLLIIDCLERVYKWIAKQVFIHNKFSLIL